MTSPVNHETTVAYFREHAFFGLPPEEVVVFPQGTLPAFDFQRRLLLSNKGALSLAPDS